MPVYNFKQMAPVPSAKDFVDIVLMRTQRKTPTVVHPGYKITRIRAFYMRKVKYAADVFHDKLSKIIEEFPRLDEIHPFYADLINVLYDRDHYKLALGQVNMCRTVIDNLAKDYVRLLKYGDSLFRCKQLKRAALGRMCTLMRKQGASLGYLEEVRKHLSRLPSIDPNTLTLLVTGYPNVGKSSFMNKITRAEVDVQPYAFTTKSLFVGHFDYEYKRWQAIDTPGILDHPLEDRNTIEMQAITALAHLQSTVMFFIDISQQCGYTIEQQVSLFNSIKPLFANKPLLIVATKIDAQPWETLDSNHKTMIETIVRESNAEFRTLSNFTEEGITDVKNTACDKLFSVRLERKRESKKVASVMNRLQVTMPKPRDRKLRAPNVPESVVTSRSGAAMPSKLGDIDMQSTDGSAVEASAFMKRALDGYKRTLEKEREQAAGGPGAYYTDDTAAYILRNSAWRHDLVPEIMDGKNIADHIDPDILKNLEALEREEEALEREALESGLGQDVEDDEDLETRVMADAIRGKKRLLRARHARDKSGTRILPRPARTLTSEDIAAHLTDRTGDVNGSQARATSIAAQNVRKRGRSMVRDDKNDDEDTTMDAQDNTQTKRARSASRSRSVAPRSRESLKTVMPGDPYKDEVQKKQALRRAAKAKTKMQRAGRLGESDRKIVDLKPKHLFSGKRGNGTTDRR